MVVYAVHHLLVFVLVVFIQIYIYIYIEGSYIMIVNAHYGA